MRKDAKCNFFLKLGMVIKRIITVSIKNVTGKVSELLLTRRTINLLVIWREWLNFHEWQVTKLILFAFLITVFLNVTKMAAKLTNHKVLYFLRSTARFWSENMVCVMTWKKRSNKELQNFCGLVKLKQKYIKSFNQN